MIENNRKDVEVVAINDLGSPEMNLHLLKYDSVHGRFPGSLVLEGNEIKINNHSIKITAERNPEGLPWEDIDIALECTGVFTDKEKASMNLRNGSTSIPRNLQNVFLINPKNQVKIYTDQYPNIYHQIKKYIFL